jgi:hypothetical protein
MGVASGRVQLFVNFKLLARYTLYSILISITSVLLIGA